MDGCGFVLFCFVFLKTKFFQEIEKLHTSAKNKKKKVLFSQKNSWEK